MLDLKCVTGQLMKIYVFLCFAGNVDEYEGDHNHKIIMPDAADFNVSYSFSDRDSK